MPTCFLWTTLDLHGEGVGLEPLGEGRAGTARIALETPYKRSTARKRDWNDPIKSKFSSILSPSVFILMGVHTPPREWGTDGRCESRSQQHPLCPEVANYRSLSWERAEDLPLLQYWRIDSPICYVFAFFLEILIFILESHFVTLWLKGLFI